MKIARENLINLLNMDLELETAAALQYINHAARLSGAVYEETVTVFQRYAHDKINNAIALADLVCHLGGFPSTKISLVHISDDNQNMLLQDIEDERDTIRRLMVRIDQAVQLNEVELSRWLVVVLGVARQHMTYLQKQAMIASRHVENHLHTDVPYRDFEQMWIEKAIKVPVRVKKTSLSQTKNSKDK